MSSSSAEPPSLFRLVAANPQKSQRLRLYRGVSLNKLQPAEIAAVLGEGELRLRTLIDIRTKEEIGDCHTYPLPDGVTYKVMQLTSTGAYTELHSTTPAATEEAQVTVYRIDFYTLTKKLRIFGHLFWNNWRLALSGWRSERFDTTDGLRMGVLKKLSSDVANSKGPAGMYLDWLEPGMDCSGLAALFRLFGDGDIYPAMLHCQYGKDRTGVACALLQLMDPAMTEEQVVDEYHVTEKHIERFLPEILAKIRNVGMPTDCAYCPKDLIREVIAWLRTRYGTVDQYLQEIGLQVSEVAAIRTALGYVNSQPVQEGQK